ncbi:MAG TPA: undecaprenyl-diphosphatase [Candidatus Magasanikbacteria bacterium]|nr:undecaprenyl-diphosphatase [Candidatus Magasanikbacteria bacterium]
MSWFQAVILGFIQGLTEFLPVSSSGHLIFLPKLFGWADQGLGFDTMLHLGSLVAVVIYFRIKLLQMFKAFFSRKAELKSDRKLAWLIILSIIPAGLVGVFFNSWIETNLRSASLIAFTMIFWGVVLWVADRYERSKDQKIKRSIENIGWRDALLIGFAQAIALIPGTSRSGITMTAGLFSKFDKKSVAEFSFLMSVPIIFLAGAKQILDLLEIGLGDISLSILLIGFLSAMFSGFLAIWGLMKLIQKYSFTPFVIYRIFIGLMILLFL